PLLCTRTPTMPAGCDTRPPTFLHASPPLHLPLRLPGPGVRGAPASRPPAQLGPHRPHGPYRLRSPVRPLPTLPPPHAGHRRDRLPRDHHRAIARLRPSRPAAQPPSRLAPYIPVMLPKWVRRLYTTRPLAASTVVVWLAALWAM